MVRVRVMVRVSLGVHFGLGEYASHMLDSLEDDVRVRVRVRVRPHAGFARG